MNKRIISIWNMCLRSHGFLTAKSAIVSTVAGASAVLTEINTIIDSITDLGKRYETNSTGTTANKNLLRDALVEITCQKIAILIAFAARSKNTILSKEMKSLLRKIPGSGSAKLINRAGFVLDIMEENLASLTDWQITPATQAEFKEQIASFQVAYSTPKQKIVERAGIRKQIESQMKLLQSKWVEMDDMLGASAKAHPEFIIDYRKNRQVENPPTSKLAALLTIEDAANYKPLQKATVITPFGTFQTSRTGKIRIKSAPDGSYLVTAKRTGFLSESYQVNIVDGITTKETIRLQAA